MTNIDATKAAQAINALVHVDNPQDYNQGLFDAAEAISSTSCAVEAAVLDDESLQAQISEIGNQIHNLSCEYQNNEPLSERLRDLRGKIWDISKRTAKPVDFASWAQNLLAAWDQQYSCRQRDDAAKALSDKLLLAACFAGIAYDAAMSLPIMVDRAPEFLLRIFLIALVDQNSSELDPYRAKNRPLPVTLTNEGTKPVDVAAVRRQAFEEGFENGVEQSLNALDDYDDITRNEAEQGIRKLKPDYRALSAEPAQGDKWQPIETAPKDGTWIIAIRPERSFGQWDRVVIVCWSDDYKKWIWPDDVFDVYKDDINETDDEGLCKHDPYQSLDFTHWMALPAAPTTEAGK